MRFLLLLFGFCLALPVQAQPDVQTFPLDSPLVAQVRLNSGRYGMPAMAVGNSVFVLGGFTQAGANGSVERIDTRTNRVSPLPLRLLPRGFSSAQAVGDSIYVFGGHVSQDGESALSDQVERFDTRLEKVSFVAPLPTLLHLPASVEVGGKIYVMGGSDEDGQRLNTLWIYDPQSDRWTSGAPMRVARECDVVAQNGKIYAIGGFNGKSSVTTCEIYDIASDTWTDSPDLPVKTSAHRLALAGDCILAFGDYSEMNRVQKFDLKSQTWTRLERTGFDARRHAAVCALGKRIYVIGGNIASRASFLDEIQVFDADKLK